MGGGKGGQAGVAQYSVPSGGYMQAQPGSASASSDVTTPGYYTSSSQNFGYNIPQSNQYDIYGGSSFSQIG